jgi:predicted hydrocarbon binding protein
MENVKLIEEINEYRKEKRELNLKIEELKSSSSTLGIVIIKNIKVTKLKGMYMYICIYLIYK